MSERIEESLSALMDGEATELELRRVLREAEQSPVLMSQWKAMNATRTSLNTAEAAFAKIDLSEKISQLVDQEAVYQQAGGQKSGSQNSPAWLKPLSGFAVAAGVAALVVMGSQTLTTVQNGPDSALQQTAQVNTVLPAVAGQNALMASDGSLSSRQLNQTQVQHEQRRLLAQKAMLQSKVSAYMQIHAQHASMNINQGALPIARAASYQTD